MFAQGTQSGSTHMETGENYKHSQYGSNQTDEHMGRETQTEREKKPLEK